MNDTINQVGAGAPADRLREALAGLLAIVDDSRGVDESPIPLYAAPPAHPDAALVEALRQTERFIAGFEECEEQEGIGELLALIRAALAGKGAQ